MRHIQRKIEEGDTALDTADTPLEFLGAQIERNAVALLKEGCGLEI